MQIIISQTVIVFDFPEEAEKPAPKPHQPKSLLEKLFREVSKGRNDTIWTEEEEPIYGSFLP